MQVPMDLFSSEFMDVDKSNGRTFKVPLQGLIWDQAPSRLVCVIHRIFLEYICHPNQDLEGTSYGRFAHDNFSLQKQHLLQVTIRIFVLYTYICIKHLFILFLTGIIPIFVLYTNIHQIYIFNTCMIGSLRKDGFSASNYARTAECADVHSFSV